MDNLLGEFMGTLVLTAFGVGCNANLNLGKSYAKGAGWICTAIGWGFATLMGVYTSVALGAPQADINPSVTLAKTYMGVYGMDQFFATIVVQIIGGCVGAMIAALCFMGNWALNEGGSQVGVFSTGPSTGSSVQGFVSEVIATFFLMFCILMIFSKGVGGEIGLAPGFGPYLVGVLIIAIGLSFGGASGYSLNMARDLGPRIAFAILPLPNKGSANWGYAWVPCVGPMVGAVLGAVVATALL